MEEKLRPVLEENKLLKIKVENLQKKLSSAHENIVPGHLFHSTIVMLSNRFNELSEGRDTKELADMRNKGKNE
ncbi:unnamed protein product [Leptidea sinapis]|uniref:Uncharacterized protein n=1 Tax=Leptidea sinapis TaxID=189913 RepID=A0A5E4Q5B9_9NEOP|nr:unnamed protein product [Leptidea sinapis]